MGGTDDNLLVASSWIYIKEGNASFVIGHKTEHVVYRMWKCEPKETATQNSREDECHIKIDYIRKVLQPLFGSFITVPKCVPVSAAFVESVATAFEGQRPAKRRSKVVDPNQRHVLSQPNFCFLDEGGCQSDAANESTLTIEIKPKLGYIPMHNYASSRSDIHGVACNFCMQQQLKIKEGTWNYTSQYCPVNLFSGNPARMRLALEGLFSTPQNNLCVFKNGERIYSCEGKSFPTEEEQEEVAMAIQSWFGYDAEISHESSGNGLHFTKRRGIQDVISLVIQALCKPGDPDPVDTDADALFPWIQCSAASSHISANDIAQSRCLLPGGCVLHHILMAQQLDTHGIEFIHCLYQRYREHITKYPTDSERLQLEGPLPLPGTTPHYRLADIPSLPLEDCVTLLRGYAVSRMARDCSVMVTLRPAGDVKNSTREENFVSVSGRKFQFACYLIDLDPKTLTKIPHYYQLEQKILAAYLER